MDNEVAPIFFILAAPDELRVKVAVAAFVGDTNRALVGLLHDGLKFRRGNVFRLASSCLRASTDLGVEDFLP